LDSKPCLALSLYFLAHPEDAEAISLIFSNILSKTKYPSEQFLAQYSKAIKENIVIWLLIIILQMIQIITQ
jgi:hypothetical protein